MNYVNDRFQELMGLEMNQKALEVMKKDVDAFMPGFFRFPGEAEPMGSPLLLRRRWWPPDL